MVYFSCIFPDNAFNMIASMKVFTALFGLVLSLSFFSASGQITVDVKVDQDQFLPGEAIPLSVRIINRSGQTLHLGNDGWLSFFVQGDDNSIVSKKMDLPVKDPFDLNNGEMATKRVDLAPYFTLSHNGTYRVTATVHISEWDSDITSTPQSFDIIEGAELWSQAFGVPDSSAPNLPPHVRKYTLVQANYLKDQLRLYVQVIDESDGTIIKVNALGPMISFSQPEAQLDSASNLHVLCQTGATAFTYSVISPEGTIIKQEVYDYVSTHPRLSVDDKGDIFVQGGIRRSEPGEIPAVKPPDQLTP
jgi:hypothetical protein